MTDLRTRDEVDPSSRGRRGAHRAAPSRLAALLPVVVVAAVVVLTALALVFFTGLGGRGAGGEVSASAPATTPTTTPPTPTTPSAPTSASTGTASSEGGDGAQASPPGDQGSDAPSPSVDERGADDGAAPPPGGEGDGVDARGAPVVVLNATRTSGIAAKTAEALKGEGWTVSRTGDADKGSVDATRVRYSDPSLESAAQAVAASLGGVIVERDAGVEKGVVTVVAGPDRVGR